jgi:hypothetical protein
MKNSEPVDAISRYERLRKPLLIILSVLFLLFLVLYNMRRTISFLPFFITWFLILTDVVILFVLARKFYNWNLFFLLIIITAFYLRSRRIGYWQVLLTLGFSGLSLLSLYSSYIFLKRYNHNVFLKYIGFASSFILSLVCMGLLWKNNHWPMAGIISVAGMILFIPFLFAFVFTIPNSNYINWTKSDRVVFFRTVIIPMVFVYTLCVLMFVLNDIWVSISRVQIYPFGMSPVELLVRPGL